MAIDPEDLRIRFKSLIFESGSMATLQCELMYMEVSSKKISKLIISVPTNQGVVRVIEREVAGGEKRIVSIPLGSIMRNWSYIPREFELKVRLGNSGDDESGAPSTSSAMMFWQLPEEEEEGSELDFKTVIIQPGIELFVREYLKNHRPPAVGAPNAPERFNILMFGPPGATKSSFVNSVITLLSSNRNPSSVAISGGGETHSTTELRYYNIQDRWFSMVDMWGIDNKNYVDIDLVGMLKGAFPSNWSMKDVKDNRRVDLNPEIVNTRHLRAIHAIIFMLPATLFTTSPVNNSGNGILAIIKQMVQQMLRMDIAPILVISLGDSSYPELREDPWGTTQNIDNTPLSNIKANVEQFFGSTFSATGSMIRIFFSVNYRSELIRQHNIDFNNYMILREALQTAFHTFTKMQHTYYQ